MWEHMGKEAKFPEPCWSAPRLTCPSPIQEGSRLQRSKNGWGERKGETLMMLSSKTMMIMIATSKLQPTGVSQQICNQTIQDTAGARPVAAVADPNRVVFHCPHCFLERPDMDPNNCLYNGAESLRHHVNKCHGNRWSEKVSRKRNWNCCFDNFDDISLFLWYRCSMHSYVEYRWSMHAWTDIFMNTNYSSPDIWRLVTF